MDKNEIAEAIKRLDDVMIIGRPIAMGAAIYDACKAQGLVSLDTVPGDRNPVYRGLAPITLLPGLSEWEFQIGPPNA